MYEVTLPVELQREEHLDRVVEIVQAAAEGDEGPVCARFLRVPMVALPGQREEWTRDNWRRLFEQFQAGPIPEPAQPKPEIEPKSRARRFFHFMFVLTSFGYILAAALVLLCVFSFNNYREANPSVVTFDKRDASITVNYDNWKKAIGCQKTDIVQMEEKAIGSSHGDQSVTFRPFCVSAASFWGAGQPQQDDAGVPDIQPN